MARISTYLNFDGRTEQAFAFYRDAFDGKYIGPLMRFGDQRCGDQPPLPETERDMVMHVELSILGGHVLMGTDCPASRGIAIRPGNNLHINVEPDTRADTERLFAALAAGGQVTMPLQDMFWGGLFGTLTDRFGVQWMFNCDERSAQ